jgi:F0F1-type ATP synthase epsilon subunit
MPDESTILRVLFRNREKIIFQGNAHAVSSLNNTGKFDILPHHINFITMIKEYLKIYLPDKSMLEFKIKSGVMKVLNDNVEIYVGVEVEQIASK